jgi:hypothetical protein
MTHRQLKISYFSSVLFLSALSLSLSIVKLERISSKFSLNLFNEKEKMMMKKVKQTKAINTHTQETERAKEEHDDK